jgi:hypothetical protein|tara:strand:- start:854 stop:1372 length:519 start_codon:yes stop_codon:yes gene_type:complete
VKEVKLWKNRKELSDKVALVDDEDYSRVVEAISKRAKWYAHVPHTSKKYYAMNGNRDLSIHRVVMNAPKGMDVDHINGDPLDNRKENLRICTRSENCRNRKVRTTSKSGYKGVYTTPYGRFQAYIGNPDKKSRHISLGTYDAPEEAARVYDRKALELHGEFALLNFPREDYQ